MTALRATLENRIPKRAKNSAYFFGGDIRIAENPLWVTSKRRFLQL